LAFSSIVEYSQQEGFYRVPLPAAGQTPQLGGLVITSSNSRYQVVPRLKRRERTPAAEGGTMGENLPRILPEVANSTSLLHAVNYDMGPTALLPLRRKAR